MGSKNWCTKKILKCINKHLKKMYQEKKTRKHYYWTLDPFNILLSLVNNLKVWNFICLSFGTILNVTIPLPNQPQLPYDTFRQVWAWLGSSGQTQPIILLIILSFFGDYIYARIYDITFFLRYWWSENPVIWLDESKF